MRELAVHYCPECGFYAFYQLSRNAVCPRCARKMTPLDMRYQDFMDLDCAQRDELLSRKLIEQSPLVARLLKPHRENNTREIIANLIAVIGEMEKELRQLEAENKKQKDTVEWMQDDMGHGKETAAHRRASERGRGRRSRNRPVRLNSR